MPLTVLELLRLIAIFFLTSAISVVTGSTSLITVPALLQFGIDPRVAVATNMFALTFMSLGGALSFVGSKTIDRRRMPLLSVLTLISSIIGARLVLVVPAKSMPFLIAVFMLAIVGFSLIKQEAGMTQDGAASSRGAEVGGYVVTFLLGIYGGFFSGGYVTLLTAAYVALFGVTFIRAVATTKVINIVSSLVATIVFAMLELIDYRLGILLGVTMFLGATLGGYAALRMKNVWLRRVFLLTVIVLALKTLLYDIAWKMLQA
jgi:uncharacterized membrane protein YfcA